MNNLILIFINMDSNNIPSHKNTSSGCDKYGTQRFELAKIVKNILKNTNIVWYIENGTLLGAFRNNSFIKHDDDFDIAILYDNNMKENLLIDYNLIKEKLPREYGIRLTESYCLKIEIFDKQYGKYNLFGDHYQGADFHHVTVDLQVYQLNNNEYTRLYYSMMNTIIPTDIFPLKSIKLYNEDFPIPNNTEKVLKDQYGSLNENAKYNKITNKYEDNV